ncbi:hypothetical protein SAMN04488028_101145 [Reichenbachiella agariperforans]|uniref:Uncharacterized protein n=1 Tax=Reichenbachiella agariperforans TaxID=156994 RepID=A0A1M6JD44_REIAG|nr:hypothetical protein SAMN04488028_101145 [Reichenbachiella agariperforans]
MKAKAFFVLYWVGSKYLSGIVDPTHGYTNNRTTFVSEISNTTSSTSNSRYIPDIFLEAFVFFLQGLNVGHVVISIQLKIFYE